MNWKTTAGIGWYSISNPAIWFPENTLVSGISWYPKSQFYGEAGMCMYIISKIYSWLTGYKCIFY